MKRRKIELGACGRHFSWGGKRPKTKPVAHICGSDREFNLQPLHFPAMHFRRPNTHLFVPLVLAALLQSESGQLIGPLLHQVDVADRIGQGFDDI